MPPYIAPYPGGVDRRSALRLIAAASPALAFGGCCIRDYPMATPGIVMDRSLRHLALFGRRPTSDSGLRVVDAHGHFFNASDVPVRGFVAECLGHSAKSEELRKLFEYMGIIAEAIARIAPTAKKEHEELQVLEAAARQDTNAGDTAKRVSDFLERGRREAAESAVEVTRGSRFLEQYRRMTRPALDRRGPLTVDEVRSVVDHTGGTEPRDFPSAATEPDVNLAFGALEFLNYMLARRSVSLAAYRDAYSAEGAALRIDTTIGALVDFDYWLDCPPFSAHEDQIELHALLSSMHGGYMRPLLAYNPWTDIALGGAGLKRIKAEWAKPKSPYVGVKIYPPMGFYPAGNWANPIITEKDRPNAQQLDKTLGEFFAFCASERVPVLAHTGQSNGRDPAHDELGGPTGWEALLSQWSTPGFQPIISFGHFGGASGNQWTQTLAELIGTYKDAAVHADLGYWEELMGTPDEVAKTSGRLKAAFAVPVGSGTVADRVMFGTDWLMLSQQRRWKQYPDKVAQALERIAPDHWRDILGANALGCFSRLSQPIDS